MCPVRKNLCEKDCEWVCVFISSMCVSGCACIHINLCKSLEGLSQPQK